MKQREILEAFRAVPRRADTREFVGGVNAQIAPTEFLHDTVKKTVRQDKTLGWAEKLQVRRDAERNRAAEVRTDEEDEAEDPAETPIAVDGNTQPDRKEEPQARVGRGASKPRTKRTPKTTSS